MSHSILLQLCGIFVLGILAQWVAWRLRVPSILLLLLAGTIVGPIAGVIDTDHLFGDLLLPIVSLAVAVILYEGGLSLRMRELREHQMFGVFCRITTISVILGWAIGALAAHFVIGFRWPVAALLGAILVVTGPTVIGPILRHLRLRGRVGSLLKWEGIVVDPLGAILALLVFTLERSATVHDGFADAATDFGGTVVVGILCGLLAAAILVVVLKHYWLPDKLHNPVSLALMFASFVGANVLQEEAGLLAVTVMGIALANQKMVSIRHVVEFKETLTVLLISCLFVTLAARLDLDDLRGLGWESLVFVAIMILVARPVSIFGATLGSSLPWRERLFLACMAPRGIVAASVASVFATAFVELGYPRAIEMVPITFLLVFVTVLVYGLSAGPLARHLGLVNLNPQGILFVGAHSWARAIAHSVQSEGIPVLMIDTDWENICYARMAGLPCQYGSALAERTREGLDIGGLGRLMAVTSNNEVNSLACLGYQEEFGRNEVYQLPFPAEKQGRHEIVPLEHRGRFLFGEEWTFDRLTDAFGDHPVVKKTSLSKEFDYESFKDEHGGAVIPLFIYKPSGILQVFTVGRSATPQPGDYIFSLAVRADADAMKAEATKRENSPTPPPAPVSGTS